LLVQGSRILKSIVRLSLCCRFNRRQHYGMHLGRVPSACLRRWSGSVVPVRIGAEFLASAPLALKVVDDFRLAMRQERQLALGWVKRVISLLV